ncbi:hypothetical protein A374_04534 [Fictibacillus macauensis ZFHKF-1]|uniref:Uncharacterized protein n=1 Tax=Fictibacillus macauensis ZFHKF-1 TaxID=1196324 RepID=I8J4U2_9BACL|nr:hypothetical protein [Fictibacillus macauensis]EIT86811.1 hypothetical protein A374_04534 [Fictibacillus macauensis ZFHKF-1]
MKTIETLTMYSRKNEAENSNDRITLFLTKFHLKSKVARCITLRRLMLGGARAVVAHILISSEYRADFHELLEDTVIKDFYLDLKRGNLESVVSV